MPQLDLLTLFLTSLLLHVVSLVPVGLLMRIAPGDRVTRRWLWGTGFLAIGALLFGTASLWPDFVRQVLASALYVGGIVAVLEGVLVHAKSPLQDRLVLPSVGILTPLLLFFTYARPDIAARIACLTLVLGVVAAIGVREIFRAPDRSAPLTFMGGVYGFIALFCLIMGSTTPHVDVTPNLLENSHWLQVGLIWAQQGAHLATVAGLTLLVAERLAAEVRQEREALAAQTQRLQDVMHSLPGIVWEANPETADLTFVSPQAEEMFGYPTEEWLAPGFWGGHMHPEDASEALQTCMRLTAEGKDHELDYRFLTRDGRWVWIRDVVRIVKEEGEPKWLRGVFLDITDRKLLEEELREAKEAAERADRAKSDFLAQMSHELRTPMNGVIALLDVALAGELIDEQRENIQVASESAARLMGILNDLLDLTRIEVGRVEFKAEPFEPRELIEGLVTLFRAQAQAKGLSLELELSAPKLARGDARHIAQIVTNLLSNAVKYTEEGGVKVRARLLSMEGSDCTWMIEVEDTGPGIPPEQRAGVFLAFQRLAREGRRGKQGVGLGLAISRQLAELMGGTLTLHSGAKGARFKLRVPLEVLDAGVSAPAAAPESPRGGCEVLVVEDDPINRFVFSKMFAALGLASHMVERGEEALELIEDGLRPDALFIDIQLPGIDGHETARRVRRRLGEACPLLVALTANALPRDRAAAEAAGMDHFLEKPLRLEVLREVVSGLVGCSEHATQVR